MSSFIATFFFYSIFVFSAISFLVLRKGRRRKSLAFAFPVAAFISYLLYELFKGEVDIRVDILLIWIVLGPVIGLSLYRFRYPPL